MDEGRREGARFLLESWLDFYGTLEQHPDLKKLLFDPVTGLPTTPLLFPRISQLLEDRGEVSLLYVDVVRYSRIEEIYGWQVFDEVMRKVARVLDETAGEVLRDADVIAELMISGNAFVVVLSPPRTKTHIDPNSRMALARRVEGAIRQKLEQHMEPAIYKKFGCYVGAATIVAEEHKRLERLVYDALEQALADSYAREAAAAVERVARLREILATEQIRTLVHPVFRLSDMEVIGYEALSRGPADSEFERPDKLFAVAYDADLVLRLERVCRKKALEAAKGMPADRLLFVNIEPEAVGDPQLRDIITASALEGTDFGPSAIVLEITERTAIADFAAFRSTLEYVRALGFGVAVDDAGAGYGSLQCLAEVKPEWLKVDLSLVRGCDSDDVRAGLIEALVTFSARVGAKLIAEGVESEEELAALRGYGVEYAQGFLLALPSDPFPDESQLPGKRYASV
jgi:EAL domain-containing protein (putative c-di-GMP-specific phosphodiesterase class I)/GGDEF domain-containing protein